MMQTRQEYEALPTTLCVFLQETTSRPQIILGSWSWRRTLGLLKSFCPYLLRLGHCCRVLTDIRPHFKVEIRSIFTDIHSPYSDRGIT